MKNKYSEIDYRSYFTFEKSQFGSKSGSLYLNNSSIAEDLLSPKQTFVDCVCTRIVIFFTYILFIVTLPFSAIFTIKSVHQFERLIVYRLGRLRPIKGPGIVLVLPCIDRWHKVDMRTKAFNIPPSKVCTVDNYIISIGAIVQFRIYDPMLTTLMVQNIDHALRDSAMSDMTSLLSKKTFVDIKSKRQTLAYDLQIDINQSCRDWGIEISRVELSDVVLMISPQSEKPLHGAKLSSQLSFGQTADLNGLVQCAQQIFSKNQNIDKDYDLIISNFISKFNAIKSSELVRTVNAAYEFEIAEYGTYFLDMRFSSGFAGKGNLPNGTADVKLSLTPETLESLLSGSVTAANAYTFGKLKVDGSILTAKKLDQVFKLIQAYN